MDEMTEQPIPCLPVTQEYDIIDIDEHYVRKTWPDVCIEDSVNPSVNNTRMASLAITLRDLKEYAYGYLICEGIVADKNAIRDVRIDLPDIHVTVSALSLETSLKNIEIRSSGCVGIRASWASLREPLGEGITIDLQTLFSGMKKTQRICRPVAYHRRNSLYCHSGRMRSPRIFN
jgi:FdhD protein